MPNAGITAEGPQVLMVPVTRQEFDALSQDVITSAIEASQMAVVEAGLTPPDVDALLLTGGTSRIPAVRQSAEQCFSRQGVAGVHPEHAVVIGAAIQAALDTGTSLPAGFAGQLRAQPRSGRTLSLVLADGSKQLVLTADQRPPVTIHHQLTLPEGVDQAAAVDIVEEGTPDGGRHRWLGRLPLDELGPTPTVDLYLELTTNETLQAKVQDRRTGAQAYKSFELR
jgi:molecular chaperone DnaK